MGPEACGCPPSSEGRPRPSSPTVRVGATPAREAAGLWGQVTPDPATLVAQMGTRALQPLLAGANPAQGDPQSARGRAGRGLAPQRRGPTTPSPRCAVQ